MRRSPATDLGLALLGLVAALFATGWLTLALGGKLTGWLLLPSALAGALVGCPDGNGSLARRALPGLGAIAVVLAAALAFGAAFHDVSWDGQAYHQEAVLALADGWNPLWDGPLSLERPDNVWINHYPKAAWIAQAILFRATGSLEGAKGLQLVAAIAAGLLGYAALRDRGLGRRWAVLVATLAAASPVAAGQAYSFYVDGLGLSLLVAAVALTLLAARQPRARTLVGLAAALVVLANLKFTGLVYAGCFVAGVTALLWRGRAAWRPFARAGVAALVLGGLVFGFDPYVTNTLRQGHPFHPVMGRQPIDFIGIQLDPAFHRQGRLRRFAVGLLARASNQNVAPAVKAPFTVKEGELDAVAYADVRLGGFGPLFSGALLVAALMLTGRRWLGLRVPPTAWAAGGLLLLTVFVNPALWWARYVPQLWLLPLGVLGLAAGLSLTVPGRAARAGLALLLVADAALVAGAAGRGQWRASAAVRAELQALAGVGPLEVRFGGFEANAERLRAGHLSFRAVATLACREPRSLFASLAAVCPAPVATRSEEP